MAICWLRDVEGIVEHNLRVVGIRQIVIAPGRPLEGERVHIVDYLAKTVGVEVHTYVYHDLWGKPGTAGDHKGLPHTSAPPSPLQDWGKQLDECVTIHPGSGGAQKCWPIESFACVIERLWERSSAVLLLAGPAEAEPLAYLRQRLVAPPVVDRVLFNAPLLEVARRVAQVYGRNDKVVFQPGTQFTKG